MTLENRDEKGFHSRISTVAQYLIEQIAAETHFRIITHLDADGLTAGSILAKCLMRQEAFFRIRVVKQIDEAVVADLADEEPTPIIFTDVGSSSLDLLIPKLRKEDLIILDHHQPVTVPIPSLLHVNPHLFGIDGAQEISGAGVAYYIAEAIDPANKDLACIAVIGALGDSQDKNSQRALIGLNRSIVKQAIDDKTLAVEKDLLFYGRETRPIHKALSYTTNPFLPGLSGEEDKCLGFLVNLGIPLKKGTSWRALNDLTDHEKKEIFSEIVKLLSVKNQPHDSAFTLIGDIYTLIDEERGTALRDAREYASLLNACGRLEKSGLGIAIAVGNRGRALDEVAEVFTSYKKTLAEYLEWVHSTPTAIKEHSNMFLLNGIGRIDEKLLGPITSILSSGNIYQNKPIIAIASAENNYIKLSGRNPITLTKQSINLGLIFQEASSKFKGSGGGHNVAAGALLPEKDFIDIVHFINEQLGNSSK
jgi:single-stranded-DNA-specific exonuclease